ncbi:MAG: acyl-[acyl-carrier-protein] thioesterase [Tannerellaceae bacterium]|jgi:acyl-ACP thioesterase|nr:acyl-[acyl-carrier-protein] thioesterase [Tannerellaceae bacterium]
MDKVGEFSFKVDSDMVDFRRRMTIPVIGAQLLHVATIHAAERGFGYEDMQRRNVAWVLSRLAIGMSAHPELSEDIRVYTWIEGASRLFTNRCFELVSAKRGSFGHARSIWAAIDMETRRPMPLDVEALNVHRVDRPCPIEKPGKIAPVENISPGEPYRIRYSDLDINGHLNSIRYMERLLDMFDIELFALKDISRFEIAYMSEGRYGMELSMHCREGSPGAYNMAICNEGKAICRAAVTWADRSVKTNE